MAPYSFAKIITFSTTATAKLVQNGGRSWVFEAFQLGLSVFHTSPSIENIFAFSTEFEYFIFVPFGVAESQTRPSRQKSRNIGVRFRSQLQFFFLHHRRRGRRGASFSILRTPYRYTR